MITSLARLSRPWKFFLAFALLAGVLLRMTCVHDMEYKEDEEYNYTVTQAVEGVTNWPWAGMPSGVYLQNPGMSVWVFIALARISGATTPTGLAHAVQVFALLGIVLLVPFALRFLKDPQREPWLWACALALVNPIAVLYQRKLWPEPFLPFFVMLMLIGWWRRESRWGAFVWGLVGAWLGQIHMSGFFLAFGFFAWTLLFGRGEPEGKSVSWKGWFAGSVMGALPLIPWALLVMKNPPAQQAAGGVSEMIQLKYWVFWLTNSLGLHVGNALGLLRGSSNLAQLSDFFRYPVIGGQATYAVAVAHAGALLAGLLIYGRAVAGTVRLAKARQLPPWRKLLTGRGSSVTLAQNAALWACGLTMTLTGVNIRRYYTMICFPFDFVFLTRLALYGGPETSDASPVWGRRLLALSFVCQLLISGSFVHYVHLNEGSLQGDYGHAYHVVMKQRAQTPPKP